MNVFTIILHESVLFFFGILGYCTEFNVAGGVIQSHVSAPCNKTSVLACDNVYYSTRAYKCENI